MAEKLTRQVIAEQAFVHAEMPVVAHPRHQVDVDRNFELPTGLYAGTVALFLGYLAVMTMGFGNPGLALPMAIFVLFVVAGFGVPALWAGMKPEHRDRPLSWSRFMSEGVQTPHGRCNGGEAATLVLLMPAVILCWGIATVTIAALAR
jgi:hypothetical protein